MFKFSTDDVLNKSYLNSKNLQAWETEFNVKGITNIENNAKNEFSIKER